MTTKEIELLVHRIISGKQVFTFKDSIYELRKSSIDVKIMGDLLYQQFYDSNLYSGYILEEDKDIFLISNQLINPSYKDILKQLEKQLENTKIDLYKNYIDLKKRKQNKLKIKAINSSIEKILTEQHSIDFLILENAASNVRNEYMISSCLFNFDTQDRVFNYPDIDYVFFNNIVHDISQRSISMSKFKEIARHSYWKNMYSHNKDNMFPFSASEYSEEQIAIINISEMYSKIYEHPNCPNDNIIEDDDALDGWMLFEQRENKKQKEQKGVSNMMSDKIKNSKEVFLMSNNDKEQTEAIFDLNSQEGLKSIQHRAEKVKSVDQPIKDSELSDVRQEIREKIRELNNNNKKR